MAQPSSRSLTYKLGVIGAALLITALTSIGLTLWVTWQLEGGAAAVNEAGRMRMQTWALAQGLSHQAPAQREQHFQRFDQTLQLLRTGDPARPLFVPRDDRSRQAFTVVQQSWQTLRSHWLQDPVPAPPHAGRQAQALVADIDAFVSAIESQLARWTALLNMVQLLMMGLAIGSAVAMLYAAYLFIFKPLSRLQAGLLRVGQGDLSARVEVDSTDEFGTLALGFNRMAQTLQGLYQNLEARVNEKTLGLQAERARLAALYQAAAFVGTAGSLEELAQGFARQLRQVGRADACAVRLCDEHNRRYMLLASDCLPEDLVKAETCLPTGQCHCGVSKALAPAQIRVIPILAADDALRSDGHSSGPMCLRAGFEYLVSVPLRAHERLLGEINLFYRAPVVLGDEDRSLLDTLASHLSSAVEGLRALALQREAAVAEERGFLARELHDSIAQGLSFLKIQTALLREGLRQGDPVRTERSLCELDTGIRESLADVRELLLHFRTRTNAEDIATALHSTLTKFEHQTGLSTQLVVSGEGLPLAADVQVQVLHVVQEALSNVRKHAGARHVWVDVQHGPSWQVRVRDDGCGFDARQTGADETHVGLRIMRERAERIGASVVVHSTPGGGTCVDLALPQRQGVAA